MDKGVSHFQNPVDFENGFGKTGQVSGFSVKSKCLPEYWLNPLVKPAAVNEKKLSMKKNLTKKSLGGRLDLYISKEVGVKILRYPVTVIGWARMPGQIVINGHWVILGRLAVWFP